MLRTARALALLAVVAVPAAPGVAAAQDLPAAKELVARYVTAIGGRDAILKYTSIRSTGFFEMPAAGLRGDLRIVQAKDGRTSMRISVPGMGELAGGYDGTTAWSMNPMQGPRLLEGKELAQMKEDAGFLTMLRESPAIDSMVTVAQDTIGGEACYKVKVSYKSGRTSFDCYSAATGLLAGTISVQESNMGTVEVTTAMTEWKEFGGIRFATRMRQQAMGQEQVLGVDEVAFDSPDDTQAFALPEPVKALVAQKPAP